MFPAAHVKAGRGLITSAGCVPSAGILASRSPARNIYGYPAGGTGKAKSVSQSIDPFREFLRAQAEHLLNLGETIIPIRPDWFDAQTGEWKTKVPPAAWQRTVYTVDEIVRIATFNDGMGGIGIRPVPNRLRPGTIRAVLDCDGSIDVSLLMSMIPGTLMLDGRPSCGAVHLHLDLVVASLPEDVLVDPTIPAKDGGLTGAGWVWQMFHILGLHKMIWRHRDPGVKAAIEFLGVNRQAQVWGLWTAKDRTRSEMRTWYTPDGQPCEFPAGLPSRATWQELFGGLERYASETGLALPRQRATTRRATIFTPDQVAEDSADPENVAEAEYWAQYIVEPGIRTGRAGDYSGPVFEAPKVLGPGFALPDSVALRIYANIYREGYLADIVEGTSVIEMPVVPLSVFPGGVEIYQPIIPREMMASDKKSLYETPYVKSMSQDAAGGICKVFHKSGNEVLEFPIQPGTQWDTAVLDTKHSRLAGTGMMCGEWQDSLYSEVPSMEDLTPEQVDYINGLVSSTRRLHETMMNHFRNQMKAFDGQFAYQDTSKK